MMIHTIGPHRFAVWRSNRKNRSNEDILKGRDQEQHCVFVIIRLQMVSFGIRNRWFVPARIIDYEHNYFSNRSHHACPRTQKYTQVCIPALHKIWPIMLIKTFGETRFAVGRLVCSDSNGRVRPTIGLISELHSETRLPFGTLTRDSNGDYDK
jgi:hypothetical protein